MHRHELLLAKVSSTAVTLLLAVGVSLSLAALWTPAWRVADGHAGDDVIAGGAWRVLRVAVGEAETCALLQSVATRETLNNCLVTHPSNRNWRLTSIKSVLTNETLSVSSVCSEEDLSSIARHLGVPDRLQVAALWVSKCRGGLHWVTAILLLFASILAIIPIQQLFNGVCKGFDPEPETRNIPPLAQGIVLAVAAVAMAIVLLVWRFVVTAPAFHLGSSFFMAFAATLTFVTGAAAVTALAIMLDRLAVATPSPTFAV
ncbi:hypothetical protein PINS_up019212 [Pythium insidiosum]|nr:hypothetical protein PINS_up019212 [Pythium insidiosum]